MADTLLSTARRAAQINVVLQQLQPFLSTVDTHLRNSHDPASKVLAQLEKKTGVKRLHLAVGIVVALVLGVLLLDGVRLISAIVAFAYPTLRSYQAIESKDKTDDTRWLIYWVVFGAFSLLENFADLILFWFPFYYTFKLVLLLWFMAPIEQNGSMFVYTHFLKKFLAKADTATAQAQSVVDAGFKKAAAAQQASADFLAKSS